LLEVMMVAIVMSAASLIGLFALDGQWIQRRQVELESQRLRQALTVIRETAIAGRADVLIRFDNRNDRLIVRQAVGPLSPGKTWEISLVSDCDIRPSPGSITFKPSGSCDRNLEIVVTTGRIKNTVGVYAVNGVIR